MRFERQALRIFQKIGAKTDIRFAFRIREIERKLADRHEGATNAPLERDASSAATSSSCPRGQEKERDTERDHSVTIGSQNRNPFAAQANLDAPLRGGVDRQFVARARSLPTHTTRLPLTRITLAKPNAAKHKARLDRHNGRGENAMSREEPSPHR